MPAKKPCVLIHGGSRSLSEIRAILEPSFSVVTGGEQSLLQTHFRCVVVVSESWETPRFSRRGASAPPIVLIGGGQPQQVRPSQVFDCIDQRRLHRFLHRAVTLAVFDNLFARLQLSVLKHDTLSRRMQVALLRVLEVPPVLTVQKLAFETRLNVRSLHRDWRAHAGANGGLGMKSMLSAVFWARVMECWVREGEPSWAAVATNLGVTPVTLRRLVYAWHGGGLSDVGRRDIPEHLLQLEGWLHATVGRAPNWISEASNA